MSTPISLWRIAAETKEYKANDISGAGAAKYPGRWNATGEHVVYAAQTLSLAVLESAAHIQSNSLPLNRFVVRLAIPTSVWRARKQLEVAKLDVAWRAIPAGKASVDIGSRWYQSGTSALLLVPSVVVPEEFVFLINATHVGAKGIKAKTIRTAEFSHLFRT